MKHMCVYLNEYQPYRVHIGKTNGININVYIYIYIYMEVLNDVYHSVFRVECVKLDCKI